MIHVINMVIGNEERNKLILYNLLENKLLNYWRNSISLKTIENVYLFPIVTYNYNTLIHGLILTVYPYK